METDPSDGRRQGVGWVKKGVRRDHRTMELPLMVKILSWVEEDVGWNSIRPDSVGKPKFPLVQVPPDVHLGQSNHAVPEPVNLDRLGNVAASDKLGWVPVPNPFEVLFPIE